MPLEVYADMLPADARAWRKAGGRLVMEEEWAEWERVTFMARVQGAKGVRNPVKLDR